MDEWIKLAFTDVNSTAIANETRVNQDAFYLDEQQEHLRSELQEAGLSESQAQQIRIRHPLEIKSFEDYSVKELYILQKTYKQIALTDVEAGSRALAEHASNAVDFEIDNRFVDIDHSPLNMNLLRREILTGSDNSVMKIEWSTRSGGGDVDGGVYRSVTVFDTKGKISSFDQKRLSPQEYGRLSHDKDQYVGETVYYDDTALTQEDFTGDELLIPIDGEPDGDYKKRSGVDPSSVPFCFGPETLVHVPGRKSRRIKDIKLNDTVLAFSSATGVLEPAKITQSHVTPDQPVIDLHGTIVTPGHAYLCPEGEYRQVGAVLNADGFLVNAAGEIIRARTGEVNSRETFAMYQAMFGPSGVPAFEVGFGVAAEDQQPAQPVPQIGAVAGATGLADAPCAMAA